jgi:hypothetical protein
MSIDDILRAIASIIIILVLLFGVLPGIFWAAIGIVFQLVVIIVWGLVGYVLIRLLEEIWKKKGGK